MDYRRFEVTHPASGESYQVEFRWLQTAISLRHRDTIDVKFLVNGEGKIIALPHGAVEQVCRSQRAPLTDELCATIAARHLQEALLSGADVEKEILTLTPSRAAELAEHELRVP